MSIGLNSTFHESVEIRPHACNSYLRSQRIKETGPGRLVYVQNEAANSNSEMRFCVSGLECTVGQILEWVTATRLVCRANSALPTPTLVELKLHNNTAT